MALTVVKQEKIDTLNKVLQSLGCHFRRLKIETLLLKKLVVKLLLKSSGHSNALYFRL